MMTLLAAALMPEVWADEADQIPAPTIDAMVQDRAIAPDWKFAGSDPLYASRPVLLRRRSGNARLTVFEGGHEIVREAALTRPRQFWLMMRGGGAPATSPGSGSKRSQGWRSAADMQRATARKAVANVRRRGRGIPDPPRLRLKCDPFKRATWLPPLSSMR
ncbi:MAG: hypothetical protein WD060_14510 [Pirellulales bacterium]